MIKFEKEDIPAVPPKQIIRFHNKVYSQTSRSLQIEGEIVKYADQSKSKLMKLVFCENQANSRYVLFEWESVEWLLGILNNLLMKRKEIEEEK